MLVEVKKMYNADMISKSNNDIWNKLLTIISNEDKDEKIVLDFKDMVLSNPWMNDTFIHMMTKHKNVCLSVYNNSEVKKSMDIILLVEGLDASRVNNIDTIVKDEKRVKTDAEIKAEQLSKFIIEGRDTVELNVYQYVTQITSLSVLDAINIIVRDYNNKYKNKEFILRLKDVFISAESKVDYLASIITSLHKDGINLVIEGDKKLTDSIELKEHVMNNDKYNDLDKAKALNKVRNNTAGMLVQYKRSKNTDTLGRYGNGEILSCKACIFLGVTAEKDKQNNSKTYYANFRTYSPSKFYTDMHWKLENDSQSLESLEEKTIKVPVTEVGLFDKFLGSKYHFARAIQFEEDGYTLVSDMNDDCSFIQRQLTIPDRLKTVFDSWGIDYDVKSLEDDMKETIKRGFESYNVQ